MNNIDGIAMAIHGPSDPTKNGSAPTGNVRLCLDFSYNKPATIGLNTLLHACAAWLNDKSLPCDVGDE